VALDLSFLSLVLYLIQYQGLSDLL
jgi:hypothetical protein